MNIDNYLEFAPILIVIIIFAAQTRIFITPEALEKKHREILNECQGRFASIIYIKELKNQWGEIKEKIDKIYDYFLQTHGD
ncbi:TPA: hypothetical protein IAA86_05510 [Candidatus Galligastranaerophilus intestinavium]|uniref:Uncharacterized protein n=1 Tax=Candidatus Galligastranaerophilus intestinavium TaxID=2840836 RepID=A0A9D1FJQ4_9BACT|nr:hypothetical protein [Candidatus Galligastranaerophilus intestinavium]